MKQKSSPFLIPSDNCGDRYFLNTPWHFKMKLFPCQKGLILNLISAGVKEGTEGKADDPFHQILFKNSYSDPP